VDIPVVVLLGALVVAQPLSLGGAHGTERQGVSCSPIPGSEAVLGAGKRYYVFGEVHGTSETPELFGDLVCAAAQKRAVVVALEFDEQSTSSLQRFIASAGGEADVRVLLLDDAWSRSIADGRNSAAMLRLLKRLQKLRSSGAEVEVYATQMRVEQQDQNYAELAMAVEWKRLASAYPNAPIMILVGRMHALLKERPDLPFKPAASHLPSNDVISFRPELPGGAAWNCQGDGCHAHSVEKRITKPRFVGLLSSSDGQYTGSYSVGRPFTASAPAATEGR
jgi:hypothetical protein